MLKAICSKCIGSMNELNFTTDIILEIANIDRNYGIDYTLRCISRIANKPLFSNALNYGIFNSISKLFDCNCVGNKPVNISQEYWLIKIYEYH